MKVRIKEVGRSPATDLTVGKIYDFTPDKDTQEYGKIIDDVGVELFIHADRTCLHLNGGSWEIIPDEAEARTEPMQLTEIDKLDIKYVEHGPREQKDAFWPHDCEECNYYQNDGCIIKADRFSGLSLAAYLALRVQEASNENAMMGAER